MNVNRVYNSDDSDNEEGKSKTSYGVKQLKNKKSKRGSGVSFQTLGKNSIQILSFPVEIVEIDSNWPFFLENRNKI